MAKGKMGAPVKEVDFDELDKLLFIQCTAAECAYFFDISEDTLSTRVREHAGVTFSEYKQQKGARGRISLRRKQFETAMKGNVTMMIWLGKQILKQSDKIEETGHYQYSGLPNLSNDDLDAIIVDPCQLPES